MKQSTLYEHQNRRPRIDFILISIPSSFQSTIIKETWLSDFHLIALTAMTKYFKKLRPKVIVFNVFEAFS